MSEMGPCDTCGEPYESCPVSDPDAHWTTDANGNHEGLCCEDCGHHAVYDYGAVVNAPLSDATMATLAAKLRSGDYPVRRVPTGTPDTPLDRAVRRVRAYLTERGPDRHNVIATAGPRDRRYGKPRLRMDDLWLILNALDHQEET